MKIISHDLIQSIGIPPLEAYHWVETMLAQKHEAVLPPKISMHQENHVFYNVMPCILPGKDRMGVKVITRHPEKVHGPSLTSQIFLYELSSGNLLAVLDGSYITAMRTGAVTAHSIRLLANPACRSIGLIGLGITAAATMDVFCKVEKDREMTVNLLWYKNQAESFRDRYAHHRNLRFVFHDTPESVIRSSEIIVSCVTYAEGNFARDEDYQPGCLVLPVHSMGFQNCDLCFDKVFVDDIGHVKGFRYFDRFKNLTEISAIVRGEATGRDHWQQRILVYNIGLAIHDIYFADKILTGLPNIPDLNFQGPAEKMWL